MGNLIDKKNDFLYFDKDSNRVKISSQAMLLDEVKILFRRDRKAGKKFFEKCIHYCYYMNHKDSPFSHQPLKVKKTNVKTVNEGMLSDFNSEDIFYKAFERVFVNNHYSRLELRYLKLFSDIDQLIEHMTDIPLYKKIKAEVKVKTTECVNGETVDVEKTVMVDQVVDNSQEKKQAISNIKSLEELREMLEKKLKTEYSRKNKASRRLFDQ